MMNILLKRLIAVLCAAVMLCAVAAPALAAKLGNITLEIKDEDDNPVVGFEVCIVKVADKNAKLIGDFKAANITPSKLKDEKNNAKNAKKLLAYVDDAAAEKKATTTNGRLSFKNLEEGIYLVYDAGNDGYEFDPFLVTMPTIINDSADYDIVASPKIDPITPPGGGGGGGGTIPTPTPEPTDDPDDPTPTPTPSGDPDDPDDPDNPTTTPTPSGDPDDPDNPTPTPTPTTKPDDGPVLPLTGVERRPIWALLGLGGLFIVAGILQLCVRRKTHE